MAKRNKTTKALDAKHYGVEPDLRGPFNRVELIKAYNWYSYNCDSDQAKAWVLAYWKEFHKSEKEVIRNVNRIDRNLISTCGWNCRILSLGGNIPDEIRNRMESKIRDLAARAVGESGENGEAGCDNLAATGEDRGTSNIAGKEAGPGRRNRKGVKAGSEEEAPVQAEVKNVISIRDRVTNRANELIAEIEVQLDNFYNHSTMFRPADWLSQQDVKPAICKIIAEYYKPLYAEIFDAIAGKDQQLKEAYSHWKKAKLKLYLEFVKSIVSAAETRATIVKATRKPRKKKEKSPAQIVAKLNYKEKDDDFKIVSVNPQQIIGCNQLWVFNTKYRTLAVYDAMGPAGLSVKGSTLTGFDEKTSIVKKLRKPEIQLKQLLEGGKVVLRKYMDTIKCKSKAGTGRINKETVLVRIVK